jgi:TonB-dependent receptor
MDGDSIGGSVNLVMKQATSKTRLLFSVGSGYNELIGSSSQPNATFAIGGRTAAGKIGLMVGGSYLKSSRGSDDFEPAYTTDGYLASNGLRDYQVTRERFGLNLALDGRVGSNTTLYLKAIGNRFEDQEYRQALNEKVTSARLERQLKDRLETQHIVSVAGRAQHAFSSGATLEIRASTAYGDEGEPNHQDTTFRQSKVLFAPNVTPTSIDPDNIQANPLNEDITKYSLNSAVITDGLTRDRDVVGSADYRMPLSAGARGASFLKFGAKYRAKHKFYDVSITNYSSATSIAIVPYLDAGTQIGIYDGRYPMGSPINASAARGIISQFNLVGVPDHVKADPANFDAHEDVAAGYGMAELYLGAKTTLVPGLRYESTLVDYTGNKVQLDTSGSWVSTSPVTGGSTSGVLMPMVHLRHALDAATYIRAAFTRTLARPDYADLVPRETVSTQNLTVSQGNPDLRATTSWNYDLMYEHYFRSVGIVSAGLFAKQITDYIYPFVTTVPLYGDSYRVTQPKNGDNASLYGMEFALQNQLRFLPGPLAGIGLYANYTYTSSSAKFLGREGETGTLPGQAKHVGNLSVWYERYGFSGRVAYNYHGTFVDGVGETAAGDIYYDAHGQLDLSFSQQLFGRVRVFADFMNLTNAPLRYYQATWDRPTQNETYHWWAMFGVKVNF